MKITWTILLAFLLSMPMVQAQSGAKLFKSNCSACHSVGKISTGPILKGARQRWIENSSEENFYKWIKNSTTVIESGDPYAKELFSEFKNSVMTPQTVSDEEIDAIFEFLENPPPPPPTDDGPKKDPFTVITIPANYSGLFYVLAAVTLMLIIGIFVMTNSIKSVLMSDKFKNRPKKSKTDNGSIIKTILIIIGLGLMPYESLAFGFDTSKEFWVDISLTDIYVILVLDVILLFVLVYLKNILLNLLEEISPRKERVKKKKVRKVTLLKILTSRASIDEEQDILMDHEYDGIRELDNNLPPWWKWGFYLTIVFAFFYMFYYHVFDVGNSIEENYIVEKQIADETRLKWLKDQALNVDENSVITFTDAMNLSKGQEVFGENCKVCHAEAGQGLSGPNLTDDYWIYGNDIKSIFMTIKYGRKNAMADMPEHKDKLNPVQIQQVASFVKQLKYTEGLPPKGELMEDAIDGAITDSVATEIQP